MQITTTVDRHMQQSGMIRVRVSWYTTTAAGYVDGELMRLSVPSEAVTMRAALIDGLRAALRELDAT